MSLWLKQGAAATVVLGPFVDDTDGKTAETALSIAQADIRLSKNGGAFAQSHNGAGATHLENGYYSVPLDTTDTGTLGRLTVAVSKSGALPVWTDFQVVPANVYDSLVGGSDSLEVDAVAISGSTTAADRVEANIGNLDAAVSTRSTLTEAQVNAQCDSALADYDAPTKAELDMAEAGIRGADSDTLKTLSDQMDGLATAVALAALDGKVDTVDGVVDAIKLKTDNLPTQPAAVGSQMDLVNVPNATAISAIQSGLALEANIQGHAAAALTAYDPPTKAEMDAGLAALSAPSAADVADAVWNEVVGDHAAPGTAGKALADASSAGDPWSTALPGAYGAGTAGQILGSRLDRAISTAEGNIRGADGDTLKTLSEQLDTAQADLDNPDQYKASVAGLATAAALATVDGVVDAIKLKTDLIPAQPAAVGSQMNLVNAPNAVAIAAIQSGLATAASIAALNNLSAAQVRAQADAALAAYDPPTKAEMDAGVAPLAREANVQGHAAAALAAYDPPTRAEATADKNAILAALPAAAPTAGAIADAVWDEAIAGHVAAGSTGKTLADAGGALGTGAASHTLTITDTAGDPLLGAAVWATSDLAGAHVVASGVTNTLGQVTFWLDSGVTYYVWCQLAGYNFANPASVVWP